MGSLPLGAQTFTTLTSFDGTNGWEPLSALVQGPNGNFYGTTGWGGNLSLCNSGLTGCGTVFEITPSGVLTTLYKFCAASNCTDGEFPVGGLVLGSNGSFYGTTQGGGTNGRGTVFEVTPTGKLSTLYNFCQAANCGDGFHPAATLVAGFDGNFYGQTNEGGATGFGTAFRISPSGTLKTLYSYCPQTDCANVDSAIQDPLIQGVDGNLYGMTAYGGAGNGTMFVISPAGVLANLHDFCSLANCTDGQNPEGGLILGADGNFYGSTINGGANGTGGTIFEITPGGVFTTLYSFCWLPSCSDGEFPYGGVLQANDGNFYGTTFGGGGGTVFQFTPSGVLTTLHNFCELTGCTDGANAVSPLVQGTSGVVYGTTEDGGNLTACSGGCGTIFSLSLGLKPFVKTVPGFGKVGASVTILGNNLKAATAVSFNGTAATFKLVSNTQIKATVPSGATTGTVTVSTPSRKLSTNTPFLVLATSGSKTPTTTTLGSSFNPSYVNQPVTYTATVTSSNGVPDGIVTFKSGTTTLGSAALNGGAASFTTSYTVTGTYSIVAAFGGTTQYSPSTSAKLSQQVLPDSTQIVNYTLPGGTAGAQPYSTPVLDAAGNLYATTALGGNSNSGTIIEVSNTGEETVLFNFAGTSGINPNGVLLRDSLGNLWGSTAAGGPKGQGEVFLYNYLGQFLVLYSFAGGSDYPGSISARDSSGNLYGVSPSGGALNCGMVFSMSPSGVKSDLHDFGCGAQGQGSQGGLVLDSAGNLYGTTAAGGNLNDCSGSGCGLLFKLAPSGTYTILYEFTGVNGDGQLPYGSLFLDVSGNLYGVTAQGGLGYGTVWEYSAAGVESVLHQFSGGTDGATPLAGPIVNSSGNVYGTTYGGGLGYGTVYEVSPAHQELVLYSFTGGNDGSHPQGGLASDSAGNLFGTTTLGGADGVGVIFEITP
ncbi:MAG TPA: choice-of-anchor tandem repeat GloVer-containing protein [Candidatus Solibacter sp.]|nr:choice-of-anchor tandem repeat GloVer-containing protein [Candidatus Solibacter sp.]